MGIHNWACWFCYNGLPYLQVGDKIKFVKGYLLLFSAIFILALGLSVSCVQSRADSELKQFRENLANLYKAKLNQLAQVNGELVSLKAKMDEKEQELKYLENLTSGIKAVSRMTAEEVAASFKISGVRTQLAELKGQEQALAARKQS